MVAISLWQTVERMLMTCPEPRPDYMKPSSVADAVLTALTLPEDLVLHELTFRPMVENNF